MNITTIFVYLMALILAVSSILGLLQRKKHMSLIFFTIGNISVVVSYILVGQIIGAVISAIAIVRTLIFFFYSYKGKKPNWLILVFLNLYAVIVAVVFWESPYDLIILFSMLIVTYSTWQNNVMVLRLGYVMMSSLYIFYNSLVGTHFNNVGEGIMIIFSVYSMYKFIKKNRRSSLAMSFYTAMKKPYIISFTDYPPYTIVYSSFINDSYNNFALVRNIEDIDKKEIETIKEQFYRLKRLPLLYIECRTSEEYQKIEKFVKKYKLLYHDTYGELNEKYINSKINTVQTQNISFKYASVEDKDNFLRCFKNGFIENVGDGNIRNMQIYYNSIKSFYKNDFMVENRIFPYIAYSKDKAISTLICYQNKEKCFIYNVTTLKKYRGKAIASRLIKFAIDDQKKYGIEKFYIVSIKYSSYEIFALKNNFHEVAQGFCFDLSKKPDKNKPI